MSCAASTTLVKTALQILEMAQSQSLELVAMGIGVTASVLGKATAVQSGGGVERLKSTAVYLLSLLLRPMVASTPLLPRVSMPGNADLMKLVKGFVLIQIIVARSGGTAVPARGKLNCCQSFVLLFDVSLLIVLSSFIL